MPVAVFRRTISPRRIGVLSARITIRNQKRSTARAIENIHQFVDLARLLIGITTLHGVLHAMPNVIAQHLEFNAPERRSNGGDLSDDVDAVAIFLYHPGEAAHLAFDPAQAFEAG
jgi:hypothetical protein